MKELINFTCLAILVGGTSVKGVSQTSCNVLSRLATASPSKSTVIIRPNDLIPCLKRALDELGTRASEPYAIVRATIAPSPLLLDSNLNTLVFATSIYGNYEGGSSPKEWVAQFSVVQVMRYDLTSQGADVHAQARTISRDHISLSVKDRKTGTTLDSDLAAAHDRLTTLLERISTFDQFLRLGSNARVKGITVFRDRLEISLAPNGSH